MARDVNDAFLHIAKNPLQHIVEMNSDVSRHSAAFVDVAFPGSIIPITSRGDICQINIIDLVFRTFINLLLQRNNRLMKTQL